MNLYDKAANTLVESNTENKAKLPLSYTDTTPITLLEECLYTARVCLVGNVALCFRTMTLRADTYTDMKPGQLKAIIYAIKKRIDEYKQKLQVKIDSTCVFWRGDSR